MSTHLFSLRFLSLLLACLAVSWGGVADYQLCSVAIAQDDGGGGGGGDGGAFGGGGGGGGEGGDASANTDINIENNTIGGGLTSGVAVDASGVLHRLSTDEFGGQLMQHRLMQARANLDRDVARRSRLRKVSLTRLAKQISKAVEEGHGPDAAMSNLAGLTRIQYIFYYPETKDIVIAGPAEGWVQNMAGRMVGIETAQPTLVLQDLAVALRTFPPSGSGNPFVYCSIDPTEEGLRRKNEFLNSIPRTFVGGVSKQFIMDLANGLQESMGMQEITLGGIPASTHFAHVMVEADYRMKLIGIGLEAPPARFKSFVAMANLGSLSRNAMCRWWFVPDYQRVRVSADGYAAELIGNGVKLVGEDEVVASDGTRQQQGRQNRASRKFTDGFTRHYAEVARNSPVFGQLRNCIDMLVAAAFIQQNDLYGQADWDLSVLGDERAYRVENYNAPERVPTAVNAIWKGSSFATPMGGGVQIQAKQALTSENVMADEDQEVEKARDSIDLSELPADQWWWD